MSLTRWRDSGGHFEFHGHSIFFQEQGEGSPALLLLHGFPSASWDFEPVWPGLADRFAHVLAPDFLGFGFSAKPVHHRYSIFEQADLCEALLRERGVGQAHLLAHDYGVSVAQELLARDAGRGDGAAQVLSCVFLNGGLFPEAHHPRPVQRLLRSPVGGLLARLMGERAFSRSFSSVFGPQTQPGPIELHDYWTLLNVHNGRRVVPRLLSYLAERRRQRERWVQALTASRVPLCLINGPLDPVSGADMAARFAQLLPAAELISLEGVGHYPQVEAPDRLLRAFLDFHRRHEGLTAATG